MDSPTYEVVKALNSEESIYTKSQAKSIRKFFQSILGDYNGKSGIMMRKAAGELYLLSGKDAAEYKKSEEEKIQQRKNLYDRQYLEVNGIKRKSATIGRYNNYILTNNEIKHKAEIHNCEDRPVTKLIFNSSEIDESKLTTGQLSGLRPIECKLDTFTYISQINSEITKAGLRI